MCAYGLQSIVLQSTHVCTSPSSGTRVTERSIYPRSPSPRGESTQATSRVVVRRSTTKSSGKAPQYTLGRGMEERSPPTSRPADAMLISCGDHDCGRVNLPFRPDCSEFRDEVQLVPRHHGRRTSSDGMEYSVPDISMARCCNTSHMLHTLAGTLVTDDVCTNCLSLLLLLFSSIYWRQSL